MAPGDSPAVEGLQRDIATLKTISRRFWHAAQIGQVLEKTVSGTRLADRPPQEAPDARELLENTQQMLAEYDTFAKLQKQLATLSEELLTTAGRADRLVDDIARSEIRLELLGDESDRLTKHVAGG